MVIYPLDTKSFNFLAMFKTSSQSSEGVETEIPSVTLLPSNFSNAVSFLSFLRWRRLKAFSVLEIAMDCARCRISSRSSYGVLFGARWPFNDMVNVLSVFALMSVCVCVTLMGVKTIDSLIEKVNRN